MLYISKVLYGFRHPLYGYETLTNILIEPMIDFSPVITTSTYPGVISSYHTLLHDHDVMTVWSLVKSFYPWASCVWSQANFFTGVKRSYEFPLPWSE